MACLCSRLILHPDWLLQASNRNIDAQRSSNSRFAKKHIFILVSTWLFSASLLVSRVAADWQSSQAIIWSGFRLLDVTKLSPQRLKCSTFAATLADNLCKRKGRGD